MCLIVLAVAPTPELRLVVCANRDEAHDRPAAPAAFWADAPDVLAGRDLKAGGTWLGATRGGRFAALTAVREPGRTVPDAPSRGGLVAGFLLGAAAPDQYAEWAAEGGGAYNGFNLLVGDASGLWYVSNRSAAPCRLEPGVHGVSNHLLDTPWPKVVRCRERLRRLLEEEAPLRLESLLEIVDDRRQAPDDELPSTGVPLEWERALSAPLIVHPRYGTRCSTALVIGSDGSIGFVERRFDSSGIETGIETFTVRQDP